MNRFPANRIGAESFERTNDLILWTGLLAMSAGDCSVYSNGMGTQFAVSVAIQKHSFAGMDGLNASRRILADNPEAAILMVTVFVSQHLANEARRAGIKGFCSKSESACIIEAIETILRGETYFSLVN